MENLNLFLLFLAGSPGLFLILHAFISRATKNIWPAHWAVLVSLAIGLTGMEMFAFAFFLKSSGPIADQAAGAAYVALVLAASGFGYFSLFNMSETALRVHILFEIRNRGALSKHEIIAAYCKPEMLEVRLERLKNLGQVKQTGGRYVLAGKSLALFSKALNAYLRWMG